jgi:hypothetical protein
MSPIEAAARSDAEFDGRPWSNLSRLTRERYIERATKAHSAATRAAYERAAKEISCACLDKPECIHPHACCREDVAAILALIDKETT